MNETQESQSLAVLAEDLRPGDVGRARHRGFGTVEEVFGPWHGRVLVKWSGRHPKHDWETASSYKEGLSVIQIHRVES